MSNPNPNPPSKTASTADSYMESLISLISKSEIRYEGIMYYLNPQDSTIALKNVRSFGTEGRKKDGTQILPSDKVYEYILFRGSDIKDLQVKSSPAAQLEETLPDDPAIIQSHCAGGLPNSSKSLPVGGSSLGSGASNDISALNLQPCTSLLPPQQSGSQVGPLNHHSTQVVNAPSHALPMSWSGYTGVSGNNGLQNPTQYANPSVPAVPNLHMTSSNQLSPSPSPFNFAVPESNVAPFNLPPSSTNSSQPIKDPFCPTSNLPTTSVDSPLPSYPAKFVGNRLSPSSVSSSLQDRNSTEVGRTDKAGSGSVPFLPVQSSYPVSSVVNSSRSLSNHPPKLITPGQISQPRASELSPSPIFFLDQGDVGAASSSSSNSSFPITSPAAQPPLLPLPPLAQKLHYTPAIGEEFDFEAMNQKFKKDEIWGHLGKARVDDIEDVGQMIGNGCLTENVEANPAYKKDDFFDSISCNSLSRGGRNGHRFSERMKLDTETFGNYQQRIHPNFVARGTGRGHYSRGMRHHHYGVRGRGHYTWT